MAAAPDDPPLPPPQSPRPPAQEPIKPFRFKRKRSHSPSLSDSEASPKKRRTSCSPLPSPTSHRSHRSRRHHRAQHSSRRRRPHTPPDDPTLYDDTYLPNTHSGQYTNPDSAFRESLFDALADDEGAAFWEGVYGQPIHTYSPYTAKGDHPTNPADDFDEGGNPRLERMGEEEYVSYVRSKMWEKSHQYIFEERKRREAERVRRKGKDEEARKWQANMDEALRRGEERRKRNKWKGVWEGYVKKWDSTFFDCSEARSAEDMKPRISWPVESGSWKDVGKEEVERFFRKAPQAAGGEGGKEVDLGEVLKKERVRWHPDKMMQRAGSVGIDEGTMKVVTAVFQVVDRLWNDLRGKV